jgi:hypothetical protein
MPRRLLVALLFPRCYFALAMTRVFARYRGMKTAQVAAGQPLILCRRQVRVRWD